MSPLALAALIVGPLLASAALVALIILSIRGRTEANLRELAGEGIVLDSGSVPMSFQFDNFRGPMVFIGSGVRRGSGRLVLTGRRMAFVPMGNNRYGIAVVERALLHRFEVWAEDGAMHLQSNEPPHASGSVEIVVEVADAATWVTEFAKAGARLRAT